MMVCDSEAIKCELVYCLTETGEGHMVALAESKWIIDNRDKTVWHYDEIPYKWISMGRGKQWFSIVGMNNANT